MLEGIGNFFSSVGTKVENACTSVPGCGTVSSGASSFFSGAYAVISYPFEGIKNCVNSTDETGYCKYTVDSVGSFCSGTTTKVCGAFQYAAAGVGSLFAGTSAKTVEGFAALRASSSQLWTDYAPKMFQNDTSRYIGAAIGGVVGLYLTYKVVVCVVKAAAWVVSPSKPKIKQGPFGIDFSLTTKS